MIVSKLLDNKLCTDPKNKNGKCVQFRSCPSIFKMAKKPIAPENRVFIQKSSCGFANKMHYVCCAADEEVTERYENSTKISTTPRTIVTTIQRGLAMTELSGLNEFFLNEQLIKHRNFYFSWRFMP